MNEKLFLEGKSNVRCCSEVVVGVLIGYEGIV